MLSGRDGRPTLAQAVVMLSDVAGPRPEPPPPVLATHGVHHRRMGPFLTRPDSLHVDSLRVAAGHARAARLARARRARADSTRAVSSAESAPADSLGRRP
jgi:hypothetical protein